MRRLALALLLAAPALLSASAGAGDWARLTAAQQQALAPLQGEWAQTEPEQRAKWLEMAARFSGMPEAERWRVQARMAEWARMTPQQRRQARQQFQQAKKMPELERAQHWGAFQSLPDAEREALARKATPAKPTLASKAALPAEKRNVVMTPAPATPKAVSPVVQQARPGATTTPISKRPQPPAHHQAGLPKIAATPGFVDPATLLPQRGPQGVAARLAASSDPASQP
jgi:hypothetical protein